MDSARLVPWGWLAAGLLAMGCDFSPALDDHADAGLYPPCARDEDCLESCVCLGGAVCVPVVKGESCARECEDDSDCQTGATNASAKCRRGACELGGCVPPFLDCDGSWETGCESDPATDEANCGGCAGAGGVSCDRSAGEVCAQGVCTTDTCTAGWLDCDAIPDGECETDIFEDPDNCGGCGLVCADLDKVDAAACRGGECVDLVCTQGHADCDLDPDSGCEVTTATSMLHCGGCAFEDGETCEASLFERCVAGACEVDSCQYGWIDCDGSPLNGCEVDPEVNPTHCGGCLGAGGESCDPWSQTCQGSECVCSPGFAVCGPSGVCTQLGTLSDCAGCSDDCAALPGVALAGLACEDGVCVFSACQPGHGDCNLVPTDGCETDLLSAPGDCGACGRACPPMHAVEAFCAAGQCDYAGCLPGFDDCDLDRRNGCEADLAFDVLNCGQCGIECSAGEVCTAADCLPSSCPDGFAECDPDDGQPCETTLGTLADCAYCGNDCWISAEYLGCPPGWCFPVCTADRGCSVAPCTAGYLNCDGVVPEGVPACETPMSATQCGSCTHDCWQDPDFWANQTDPSVFPTCALENGGYCQAATCEPPLAECDRQPEACETSLLSVTDCGWCGRSCLLYAQAACVHDGSCTMQCVAGECSTFACPEGWVDCVFEDNVLCETLVTAAFDCRECGGHCPVGHVCQPDGACKPRSAVSCGGTTCLADQVCCLSPQGLLGCVEGGATDSCVAVLRCTGPEDCPESQECCLGSNVGGFGDIAEVACRPEMDCQSHGILCDTPQDCETDLGVITHCCPSALLPGLSTCSITACN